ncbi:MAG: AAA family ATPase [Flammeovirgaceae bacterium]
MQKLPIGIQDFREVRTKDFLYVDKTPLVYQLVNYAKYFFLSRPRRFGKSMLVSTIAELFQGSQDLFKGLWIEDQWDWSKTNPVIEFKFNSAAYQDIGLDAYLFQRLGEQAARYGISLHKTTPVGQLEELILALSQKLGQVVMLVDEYDKPIIDYLDDIPQAEANRNTLKKFYSALKPLDLHIRMVFLTGVSKFSRTSIFSDLNNLKDLTTSRQFNALCGITQEELDTYFVEENKALAVAYGEAEDWAKMRIKKWYNGYAWGNLNQRLYNPFSILQVYSDLKFDNYWFASGTPTFLIKLLKNEQLYDLEERIVPENLLGSYELAHIAPDTLLFQTGYLTIKGSTRTREYILGYPNQEVKESMLQYLLADYVKGRNLSNISPALRMANALLDHELDQLPTYINALIGSIPYELHQNNEAYYHTVMHLAFSLIGVHIQSEVHVAKGRLDSIIQADHAVYIFEFKVNDSAENAIEQIKKQGYVQPYLGQAKPVYAIGASFNTELKEVDSWLVEELKG